MTIEYASVICITCDHVLSEDVPYEAGDDHEATGLAAGVAATHRASHPGHEVTFGRHAEPQAPAPAYSAEDRAALAEAAKRHHEEVAERLRRRIERGDVHHAPPVPGPGDLMIGHPTHSAARRPRRR